MLRDVSAAISDHLVEQADAVDLWEGSSWVAETFGEEVQKHYANMGRIEIEDFARTITDWERFRGFERL